MVSASVLSLTLMKVALLMPMSKMASLFLFPTDVKVIGDDTENILRQSSSYDFI